MKTKRILAAILACSMAFGMSVNALAADLDGTADGTIPGEGTVTPAVIKVSVPTSLNFVIDPYNLDGKGQVVPSVGLIQNLSNVDVDLVVSACTGAPVANSGAKIATALPTATTTNNDAYLAVRTILCKSTDTALKIPLLDTTTNKFKAASATVAGDVLATTAGGGKGMLLASLEKAVGANPSAGVDDKGVIQIGVVGAVATAPTTPWKAADTLKVDLTFKIVPKLPTP